ncbi:MAG: tetratricopeptide repeat protein [Bacteroidia bacterium]
MSSQLFSDDRMLQNILAREQEIERLADPYARVDALNAFCLDFMDSMEFTERCFEKVQQCAGLLETIDYPKGKAWNTMHLASYYWAKADPDASLACCDKVLTLFKGVVDPEGVSYCKQLQAINHIYKGNYQDAFQAAFEAVRKTEKRAPSLMKCWAVFGLGVLYSETRDLVSARTNFEQALNAAREINHSYGIARSLCTLGGLIVAEGNQEEGRRMILESVDKFREIGHRIGLSRALNDLGVLCRTQKNYAEAERYLQESFEIRRALGHKQGQITSAFELGQLLLCKEEFKASTDWLLSALKLAEEVNARSKAYAIHKALASAYKGMGEMSKAFSHLEHYVEIQAQVLGQETARKLREMETRIVAEKAEKEAEIERLKNVELKNAHDALSEKNKDIFESLQYARYLQTAILTSSAHIREQLKDSFVFYRPKDVVAGDFYWLEHDNKSGKIFIAAADCTGHGVPGAIVSIVCSDALNRAVRESGESDPGRILDLSRELIVQAFGKSPVNLRDGMDISICTINPSNGKVQWAGANSPLWYTRQGEMLELIPDKQPAGFAEHAKSFTTHSISPDKGECLYLFSDGFADQFGGEKGKKFKYRQLKELLLSNAHLSMEEQSEKLAKVFDDWKGPLAQTDDVLVVGIRL